MDAPTTQDKVRSGICALAMLAHLDAAKVLLTAVRAVGVERASLGQKDGDAGRLVSQTVAELEAPA